MLVPEASGVVVPGPGNVAPPPVVEGQGAFSSGVFSPSFLSPPLTAAPHLAPVPGTPPQALTTPYIPPQ